MPTFDAAIFDLDGTLVDSLGDIGGTMNDTLQAAGYPTHPMEAYRSFVGEGIEVLVRRALPQTELSRVPETVVAYRTRYQQRMTQSTALFPGIAPLLDALVARKLTLAVLSNKRDDFTVELVRRLLARWPFSVVRGEREGVPRKPDPTSALEIARELKVSPARCAFVGDTPIDILTARAAGMAAFGVTWGFRPGEELKRAGADHVVDTPDALGMLL